MHAIACRGWAAAMQVGLEEIPQWRFRRRVLRTVSEGISDLE
jgi:hypothetical protein